MNILCWCEQRNLALFAAGDDDRKLGVKSDFLFNDARNISKFIPVIQNVGKLFDDLLPFAVVAVATRFHDQWNTERIEMRLGNSIASNSCEILACFKYFVWRNR